NYYQMQGEVGNFLMQDVEGRWTPDNPDASKPRIWNRYNEYWRENPGTNTYWLQNSDYVRLKHIELGYSLPAAWCRKFSASSGRIFVTGLSILTLTQVRDFDAETASATAYPLNKVCNFGVSVTFWPMAAMDSLKHVSAVGVAALVLCAASCSQVFLETTP